MAERKIVKRRIGEDGLDVECEAEEDIYFDLKDDKKTTYEQGRGFRYRKTIYEYNPNSDKRKYIDEPLEVKNPEEESVSITYQEGVLKHYWVESGRGYFYMKTRVTFDNTEENTGRKVREQRVEGEGGDYVDVERVKSFKIHGGRGFYAQGKRVERRHEEDEIEAMEGDCKESE